MNRWQLIVLWIVGIVVSGVLYQTGSKLLTHAATNAETWATGYPLTVLAGTAWSYLLPIVIIGVLLMITVKDSGK